MHAYQDNMFTLFCSVLLVCCIVPKVPVDAIIKQNLGCSKIYSGSSGEILTPDYPQEYPNNLVCAWAIKAPYTSRIRITFTDFKLERSDDCFDRLIVKDGIQSDSPLIGTYCASDAFGLSLTSSGNTLLLNFITDASLGDKGIRITWKAINKVSLKTPTDGLFTGVWTGFDAPTDIISFEAGLQKGTVWAIDKNNDIFFFDGQKWDIQPGKLQSITIGESGIFGIHPTNQSIYWRYGGNIENPKGYRWELLSGNGRNIVQLESSHSGILYGLDNRNNLMYASGNTFEYLDNKWKLVPLDLENGGRIDGSLNGISCGMYSCFVTTKAGDVYGMTTPSDPTKAKWIHDFGNFRNVSVGFGNNIWAINELGNVFKKDSVNNIHMMGKEWKKQYGFNAKDIVAGLTGVYALAKDGSFGQVTDAICGGFLFGHSGTISSPNYPSKYPPNQSCLWIIRPKDAKMIDLNFDSKFDIKASPMCKDYLTTTYPGITEPIVECGKTVVDKRIQAEQVWIEFVSDDSIEGSGFKINYQSADPSAKKTTRAPAVTTAVDTLPPEWVFFKPDEFFEKQFGIKVIVPYSERVMWGLTDKGQAFMRAFGTTRLLYGNGLKSLATNGHVVWAIDANNNLVFRTRLDGSRPEGVSWRIVVPSTGYKRISSGPDGHYIVLKDNDELHHCIFDETSSPECQFIAKNVKTSSSSVHGTWFVDNENNLFFLKVVRKPNNKYDFITKNLRTKIKDIQVTKAGDVWALYTNDTLTTRKGITPFKPYGLKWENSQIVGEKMHTSFDNVHVVLKDGQIIALKDPVKPLPDSWQRLKSNVNTPYKIDAYPKENQIDVWVLGGPNGRIPYQGTYKLDDDEIDFQRRGDIELKSISVGESGVWGISYKDMKARFYDHATKKWVVVPNDDKNWDVIESASPLNNVYAIDYEYSELYFREGINVDNPLGAKWVYIGLSATQVSSGSHVTYIVTEDGALKSFSEPPTSSRLKTWPGSLRSYLNELDNTFSVGFGGVVVFLDQDSDIVERNILLPRDETDDTKWVWKLNRGVGASDISAGPVIFGIAGNSIVAKKVTSCFGYYHEKKDPITVQLNKRPPDIGMCTWVITSSKPAKMSASIIRHNFPVSSQCSSGGVFYSTNHQTPLSGEFKQHCGNSEFKEVVSGTRMFYQYFKDTPLPSDELEMRFDMVKTDPGCGGSTTKESGKLSSPKYPQSYPNDQACVTVIKVPSGKLIQLTIDQMDIEYGGSSCDYDYLQINNGEFATDPLVGKYCGKKTNLVLTTSSNVARVLFKSDDSGNAPGFHLSWKTIMDKRTTTAVPVITTPYTGCGGNLNANSGQFTSPNWPSNYPGNQDCKWYITADSGKRVRLALDQFDVEGDQECLYDYLAVYDGLVASSKYIAKICGVKKDFSIRSTTNTMLVVFHSDSSTMSKGFLAKWDTNEPAPTTPVPQTRPAPILKPSNWEHIHPGYKFNKLKSDYKGVIWAIGKDDDKIYSIDKNGIPPKLITSNLYGVYALSLGKYSLVKNGAWALAGPNRDIFFFNVSNYDKDPWMKVRSIDGSKNSDIVTTLFNTYLVKEDGHIFYRQGMTKANPIGEQWYLYDRGNGITESIFGVWLITQDGKLKFKKFGTSEFLDVKKPDALIRGRAQLPVNEFTQVVTGFGNKVYAVADGALFSREGVTFRNPSGISWKSTGVEGVRDVSVNNFGVFVLLNDERMIKLDDVFCGGLLSEMDGEIRYPEFQNTYSSNQYCLWYLKLDGVDQIVLNQRRFDLENSQGCIKDRVTIGAAQKIENGMEVSSYCNKGLPNGKHVLTGDKALIEFLSDDNINRQGFSFIYSGKRREDIAKACGGEFESDIGRFQSKKYPRSYRDNLDCEWKITSRENTNILITFDDMNIKAGSICGKTDYLQVYDGNSKSATILKMYCNENGPQKVRSSGNKVLLRFKTDGSKSGRGFSGYWRAEPIKPDKLGCGDTFTASSGSIKSPNFPEKYDNYADCNYLIRLKPSRRITLKFARFSVEGSANCERDYVKIYNVDGDGLRSLAKTVCGSESIDDFESGGHRVDIEFKSDGTTPYPGFDIRYLDTDILTNPVYPSGWTEVSTPQKVFVQLDAVVESPGAWAMDSRGYPYHFNPTDKTWTVADYLSNDISITPGKYGVYALKQNGELYFRYGVSPQKPDGQYWRRIIPDGDLLSTVDYGAYGELVAIGKNGDVLLRSGVKPIKPQGNKWKLVAQGFKSVSIGSYGYWLVDNYDNVFFAAYVPTSELGDKFKLTQVSGKFKKVSAGFGGNVWAIDGDNQVFMRLKINFLNPSGTSWSKVPNLQLSDVASGYDAVYGITLAGRIVRYSDSYCGGLSTSPTGSFSSPNFPLFYPNDTSCLYIIQVPGYNAIKTDIVQFALEASTDCDKDYFLTSKDGQFPSGQPTQKNCGRNKESINRVFGNRAWYEFSSDGSGQDIGFFVEWKASKTKEPIATRPVTQVITTPATTTDGLYKNCGGTISGTTGTIVHPSYPNNYMNNRDCSYEITVASNKVLRVMFDKVDMEDSGTCRYDYIEVIDSFNFETKRYCRPGLHNDFISFGRSIIIAFKTDQGGVRSGFRIRWVAVDPKTVQERKTAPPTTPAVTTLETTEQIIIKRDCGKVYRAFSGYIYHPSYPLGYRNNLDCIWTVVVPRGEKVNFDFQFFRLESSSNCSKDYVAIYEGASDKSPLVNKYCGSVKPPPYTSKKNIASIRLKTDHKGTKNGFVALYKRVKPEIPITDLPREVCGGDETGRTEGYITSPNYPNAYDSDRDCFYSVTVKKTSIIKVQFIEFDLDNSYKCSEDYVQLRSGGNVHSENMGKFCGDTLSAPVTTSGNQLFVRFRSDSRNNGKGFKLYWKEEASVQGCRYDMTGSFGEISSPGYPNNYKLSQDCYWYVSGESGRKIKVIFKDVQIEDCGGDVPFDYLRIIDGNSINGKEIGKYCGSDTPQPVITSTNNMIVHFHSDDRVSKKGFRLEWRLESIKVPQSLTTVKPTSKSKDCISDLSGTSGTITHPSYPDDYKINKDCRWRITVSYGKKIQITMKQMEIESAANCGYDFIKIKDGVTDNAAELGKYCGRNLPKPVTSSGNKLTVQFVSDDQYTRKGFKLEWIEVSDQPEKPLGCKFNLSGNGGEIKHPNYPLNYGPNKNCEWLVTVENGKAISLIFKEMDIERSPSCQYDVLSIRDGVNDGGKLLANLCGKDLPRPIISSGNEVYINFKTNNEIDKKGFKIMWKAVDDERSVKLATTLKPKSTGACSTRLSGRYGTIKSPNYPSDYDLNKDCFWQITAPPGSTIQLTFNDIDTESSLSGSCYDYIQVYDGSVRTDRSLGKFCGRRIPQLLKSTSNTMLVRFFSDDRTPKKGFQLTWRATKKGVRGSSKCEKEVEAGNSGNSLLLGTFTPQCRNDGLYEKKQCHTSSGYCWCVGLTNGREVLGTRKGPGKGEPECGLSKCESEIIEARKREMGLVGAFIPECKETGDYVKKQCHGSTGYCWCVEETTGKELVGTRKGPGLGDPECHLSACERQRKVKNNLRGVFIPTCKVDGSYENKQCHSSTGHCWCVESKTGKEIAGTRKGPGKGEPDCGLSKCQREAAEVGSINSDVYVVKCKLDGSYYRKQCYARRQSCWCVDPETGKEIEGTWRGPNDGTPECGNEKNCNPACPYNYEPVCGTNGKSYSNKCLFKYAKCKEPTIELSYEGECTDANKCSRACSFLYDPVCGTDGVSYSNPCTFNIARCQNPLIKIAYTGSCRDDADCNRACPFNYEPVCGTDGVSYSNECVRRLAECTDPTIKLAYNGNCKDCTIVCPYNYEPVCGSDGKSYSNKCILKNAQCKDSSIKQVSKGQCSSTTRCEDKACTKEYNPVCGSDKNTYSNLCLLQIAQCKDPSITIAYNSKCKSIGYDDCSRVFTEEQGTVTHRNYPNDYRSNQDCIFTIRASFNTRIVFYFQKFDLEPSNGCVNDYVSINDGVNDRDAKKYCGSQYPGIIRSTAGSLKIRFKTNGQKEGKGFVAKYYLERIQGPTDAPKVEGLPVYRSSHQLSGDSGIVAHPGYPNIYENNVDSTWSIEADPSNKIILKFDSFLLEDKTSCDKDYVEVYDGDKKTDKLIGRYCSSNPGRLDSTGNKMLVVFHSDDKVTNSGFLGRWNTEKSQTNNNKYDICGSRPVKFDGNQIEVHSPNFDGYAEYPPDKRCILQLTHLPNTVFHVEIIRFFLQAPSLSCFDYLSIRDGDNKNSNELAKICGQNVVKSKISTNDNKIYLEFISDGNTEDRGFSILISSSERPRTQVELSNGNRCGQSITGRRGTITNPTSLPSSIYSSVCVWKIETSPGSQVEIKFDLLNLSDDCDKSYILLREGEDSNSREIQKICGYKDEMRLSTQGNKLWMEYKTPRDRIGQFVMRWSEDGTKDFQCGGTVTGRNGFLTSPFYPKTFDDDIFCLWIILAKPNQKVSLSLKDTRLGPDCAQSYAIIRDGMTSGSTSLGKFCGNSQNGVTSSGHAMWVELKATCLTNKAFKAFWSIVEDDATMPGGGGTIIGKKSPGIREGGVSIIKLPFKPQVERTKPTRSLKQTVVPEVVTNVFGATMITGSGGDIKSPNFPKNYPHDRMKVWILRGPKRGKITLQFTTFDIESDSHCLYDYVEVRDGGFAASPSIGRFCGTKLPPLVKSTTDKLWIKFRSDSSTHAPGFSADWKWIESSNNLPLPTSNKENPTVCGGVYTAGTGIITSPSFPDLYPNNMECVYIIRPPQAQRIRLDFNTFDLEADYKCSFDFLEVKEGSTENATLLAKLCQSKMPNPIVSKRGALWIRFKSDVTSRRQGFSATWVVLDNSVQ